MPLPQVSIEMQPSAPLTSENELLMNDDFSSSVNISWHKINLQTKTSRSTCRKITESRQILNSVSGKIDSGQLLAILGPSGSGKTTLLNVLTGRHLSSYDYDGAVYINGQPSRIDAIKSLSGYVQQGDLFVPMLTVREFLIFQSLVRMDGKLSKLDRSKRIDDVIAELGLTKCADSRIGNRYDDIVGSGISGGELRRLSFAAELLTNPPLLFADEPTSGLDSYLAESIVNILKKLTKSGRTVIFTVHQPSSEVFILFDKFMLLTEGRVAFFGTANQAQNYFSQLGFVCPTNFNPADFYLKQVSIIPGSEDECRDRVEKICSTFDNKDLADVANDSKSEMECVRVESCKKSIYKATWTEQFTALLWRSYISNIREPMITRIKFSQTLTVALLLGIVYWDQQLDQKGIMNINGAIFILIINLTFMNVFSVINTFCSELPIFLREHNNGMYRVDTYFLSKMISELPIQIIMPTLFVAMLYYMVGFNPSIHALTMFLFISILVANCGMSFGYMISCISSSTKMAIALSSPLILPLLLFGGFFINNSTIPVYFKIFKYVSWFYYGNEALIITQWKDISNITCSETTTTSKDTIMTHMESENRCLTKGTSIIEELSFDSDNILVDIFALIILIFAMRSIGFFALFLRSKQR